MTMMARTAGTFAVFAVLTTTPIAQERRAEQATLNDLLRELQTIRADLQSMSRASLRLQALVARVSLQEQRLKALSEQLNVANTQLTSAVEARESKEQQLKQLEHALANAAPGGPPRDELEQVIAIERPKLAAMQAREAEVRARVSELAGLVTMEQDRWTDFNNRLDAVEQSLQK